MFKLLCAIHARLLTLDPREERGASMVEYGLLVGLIAVVCLTAVQTIGNGINDLFNEIADAL
jgi:pilus assembly protein Flp/PilA